MCGCLMKSKLPVPSDKKQPLDEDPRGRFVGHGTRDGLGRTTAMHHSIFIFSSATQLAQMKQNTITVQVRLHSGMVPTHSGLTIY